MSSQNRIESEGVEEEEEEPRRIGFLEGKNFLCAMTRRLNEREGEKKDTESQQKVRHMIEEKTTCNEHVTC